MRLRAHHYVVQDADEFAERWLAHNWRRFSWEGRFHVLYGRCLFILRHGREDNAGRWYQGGDDDKLKKITLALLSSVERLKTERSANNELSNIMAIC